MGVRTHQTLKKRIQRYAIDNDLSIGEVIEQGFGKLTDNELGTQSTTVTIRTTEAVKERLRCYAFEHGLKIGETFELALAALETKNNPDPA